jgi:hypothetical protein
MIKDNLSTALQMYVQGYKIQTILDTTYVCKKALYSNISPLDAELRKNSKSFQCILNPDTIENIRNDFRNGVELDILPEKYGIDIGIISKIFTDCDRHHRDKTMKAIKQAKEENIELPESNDGLLPNAQLQDGRLEWVTAICINWLKGKRSA